MRASPDLPAVVPGPTTREQVLERIAASGHAQPELLAAFTQVALRRLPEPLLQHSADLLAERLTASFEAVADPTDRVLVRVWPTSSRSGWMLEVVAEDRPFVLSTVVAELESRNLAVGAAFHPIVGIERDVEDRLEWVGPARGATQRASVIQVEVEGPRPDEHELTTELRARLDDVRIVTDDHGSMRTHLRDYAARLTPTDDADVAALAHWLLDDHLVLLGVADTIDGSMEQATGLLGSGRAALPDLPDGDDLLVVSRTRQRSPVQRRVPMEVFAFGDPVRGRRVVVIGLLTRKGVAAPAATTPVLRQRLADVLEREDVVEGSHDALNLTALFQALPKDELLRCSKDELHELLVTLLEAEDQQRVRAVLRPHPPSGRVSILLAVPRDRWNSRIRDRIATMLERRFHAQDAETDVALDQRRGALVRIVLEVADPRDLPAAEQIEHDVAALIQPWEDAVLARVTERGVADAPRLARMRRTVVDRLPLAYQDSVSVEAAIDDVLQVERLLDQDEHLLLRLETAPRSTRATHTLRLVATKRGEPLELSAFLPLLESLGLEVVDEVPHRLVDLGGPSVTLHDFGVRAPGVDPQRDGARIAAAVLAAWRGHLEVDGMNRLVLLAGLDWFDVSILRTYRRLRRQLGSAHTPEYIDGILASNPAIVGALVAYFHARFDPEVRVDDAGRSSIRDRVLGGLDELGRLDHDRVLRGLLDLVDATVRTNAFRSDARADDSGEPYIALKLDSARIPGAPTPVPYREIFVHSPRMEGIHLRGGPVARGGIRWSDRRDDVRTEVLGLLRAQVTKNAVIVPTGAKGGFVLSHEPDDPVALRAEVRRQYVTFMRALLDVTDNRHGAGIVHPPQVRRHDGDDPYLVVAADRGTAVLSDTANAVAARYGFWLDDAFASGGSQGYDHKGLGVTARGAWVAVRRHFRELGIDPETEPVTVAGVGDMSGDVFGNGLVRSRTIRLLAAFDHRHIFVDPDPDPEASFTERRRLYDLPGSSWDDYDRALLSAGGFIVPRTAREVTLPEAARHALRVEADRLSPPELVQAILRAPVDLLFAGGIGTYVKATGESDEDAGDRANDQVRVHAGEVRARVVGEGANLFMTQRARIELARRGGRLNQDAVDNAAGVITSDLEVLLKILFRRAQDVGRLDRAGRDHLLADLAGEVVTAVLATVDRQTAAISRDVARSATAPEDHAALISSLEVTSGLDREEEALPDAMGLRQRAEEGAGLCRPEVASLLAWAKRFLQEALIASEVPDSPLAGDALPRAFPPTVRERFGDLLGEHPLRRDLVASMLTNDVVDRMGATFVTRLAADADRQPAEVVLAFQAVRGLLDADRWWQALDALEDSQDPERVRELEGPLESLVVSLTRLALTDPAVVDVRALPVEQRPAVGAMLAGLSTLGTPTQRRARTAHARWLVDDLVEPDLARLLACATDLELVPDLAAIRASGPSGHDDHALLDGLLHFDESLGIDRLHQAVRRVEATGWSRRQALGLELDLRRARRVGMATALAASPGARPVDAVAEFVHARRRPIATAAEAAAAAARSDESRMDALGVAARLVRQAVE